MKLDRVTRLNADFGHAAATCEQVGRGSIAMSGQLPKSSQSATNPEPSSNSELSSNSESAQN